MLDDCLLLIVESCGKEVELSAYIGGKDDDFTDKFSRAFNCRSGLRKTFRNDVPGGYYG